MKNKHGFTLVELLAVIVILAIILVIAVPQILNVIKQSREGSIESSTKLLISSAEEYYVQRQILGITEDNITGTDCLKIAKLSEKDYDIDSCEITFDEKGNVSVTLNGAAGGKFDKLACTGDRSKVECEKNEPVVVKSFAEDSWATIAQAVKNGQASEYANDTTTKTIKLKAHTNTCASCIGTGANYVCNPEDVPNGKEYQVRIANTSPCDGTLESETACGLVIEFVDIIEDHNMNSAGKEGFAGDAFKYGNNKGSWNESEMREYLNDVIYNALPDDLKSVMIKTKVVTGVGGVDKTGNRADGNFETEDWLYLLSPLEVWGESIKTAFNYDTTFTNDKITRQLDWYEKNEVTSSSYSKAVKKLGTSSGRWWLRVPIKYDNYHFWSVFTTGNYDTMPAYFRSGLAPAFRIGK